MLRGARHKTFVASAQLTPGFGGGVGPGRWVLAHGGGSFTLPWCGNCFGAWGLVPLFWCGNFLELRVGRCAQENERRCSAGGCKREPCVANVTAGVAIVIHVPCDIADRCGVAWCCLCNKGGEPGWCGLGTLVKADVLVARGDIADVPGGDARIGVTPE